MVKLVDTLASGASGGNPVEVQVLSSAPFFSNGLPNQTLTLESVTYGPRWYTRLANRVNRESTYVLPLSSEEQREVLGP